MSRNPAAVNVKSLSGDDMMKKYFQKWGGRRISAFSWCCVSSSSYFLRSLITIVFIISLTPLQNVVNTFSAFFPVKIFLLFSWFFILLSKQFSWKKWFWISMVHFKKFLSEYVRPDLHCIGHLDRRVQNICFKAWMETKNSIFINVFDYENKLRLPIYISAQKFENSMDLLLIINENKSHYMYIKDWQMFHKTINKNKKYFCKSCLQCFSSINVLTKEVYLSINGARSVRLEEKGTIGLKIIFNKYQFHFNFMLILGVI